jgi:hypothetical protein
MTKPVARLALLASLLLVSASLGSPGSATAGESPKKAAAKGPRKRMPGFASNLASPGERLIRHPKDSSPAERAFVEAMAHEVERAMVVVAADPAKTYARGTLAEHVQKTHARLVHGKRSAEIQQRAKALLQSPPEMRARYFGSSSAAGSDAQIVAAAPPGLAPAMKAMLIEAVKARMSAKRDALPTLAGRVPQGLKGPLIPSTTLEVGHFLGDVVTEGSSTDAISAPEALEFRWKTTAVGATDGVWRLVKVSNSWLGAQEIATGVATAAPGGVFTIDLTKWLPAQPGPDPTHYEVRVCARKGNPLAKGKAGAQHKLLGLWSAPVKISYQKSNLPKQLFPGAPVFRTAEGIIDAIELVSAQSGFGDDEIHAAGFVAEYAPGGGSADADFHYSASLSEGSPKKNIGEAVGKFKLPDPDESTWPRVFAVCVSMMEEDSGGDIAEWAKATWDWVGGKVYDAIQAWLVEEWADFAVTIGIYVWEVLAGVATEVSAVALEAAATALAGACSATLIGAVVAVVVFVIAAIIEGLGDDYYGTDTATVVLPTSLYEYFGAVAGSYAPGDQFNTVSDTIALGGPPAFMSATTAPDGVAAVRFHFRFSDKKVWSPVD